MGKRKLLSGNFETDREAVMDTEEEESGGQEFEKEALKKLGGSIAFARGGDLVSEG